MPIYRVSWKMGFVLNEKIGERGLIDGVVLIREEGKSNNKSLIPIFWNHHIRRGL